MNIQLSEGIWQSAFETSGRYHKGVGRQNIWLFDFLALLEKANNPTFGDGSKCKGLHGVCDTETGERSE